MAQLGHGGQQSITVPLQGPIIPAGSRIRAKLMSDQAGVTVGITIFGHRY